MSRKDSLQKLNQILIQRRDALRRALDGDLSLLQELHGQKTGDPLDAAADTIQDELTSQLLEVESRELLAIEDAIERLAAGNYGDCESCEKPIPITRLKAVPYATDCIDCRRRAENQSGVAGAVTWNRVFETSEVDPV